MQKNNNFIWLLCWRVSQFLIAGLLLSYCAPFLPTDKSSIGIFLGLLYPFLVVTSLVFVACWLLFRGRREAMTILLVVLLGLPLLRRNFQIHFFNGTLAKNEQQVRLLSWNIANTPYKVNFALSNAIERIRPDIICLQEMHPRATAFKNYPFSALSGFNTRIYSNFPILKSGTVLYKFQFLPSPYIDEDGAVWADIQIKNKIIRFYSVHLLSYNMTYVIDKVATEFDKPSNKNWSRGMTIFQKMRRVSAPRAKQAQELAAHIRQSPYPVVITGDFNECPQSYVYRHLSEGLHDAFVREGSGFGWTFNQNIPFLKIDYTFYNPNLKIIAHKIESSDYTSDHFAQVTDFAF